MSQNEVKFWKQVQKQGKAYNQEPVQLGQIVSKSPLLISFNGIEIGTSHGDKLYINSLLLDSVATFDTAQQITCSEGTITENHTPIINSITQWIKSHHQRYIISVGDYVGVQKLGNNTYLILEKVQLNDN